MTKKFEPTWESLKQYTIPEWYIDGKFGIFIHWGPYCVPAFGNEWYPRNMYLEDDPAFAHHIETYGNHTEFGYKDFIPMFTAEKFNADEWVKLFKEAGAKFIMPVAEHHDGFAMYDSDLTEWSAAKMGPKRDVIGELADATRKEGLIFAVSSHRAEHWWFFDGGQKFPSDVQDPANEGLYGPAVEASKDMNNKEAWKSKDWEPRPDAKFLEDWLARCCEVVDKYQPQIVWFDWWIEQIIFEPYLQRFAAYYYNRGLEWGKGVAINHKFNSYPEGVAVFDVERGQLSDTRKYFWQNDTSVSKNSWGYIENHDYKSAGDIICDLVDIVSKNGALLLNIGPKPDGTIPQPEQDMLREIGRWLDINGEGIYGSKVWDVFGEGPTEVPEGEFTDTKRSPFTSQDVRFTHKGNTLYAFLLAYPDAESTTIKSLPSTASIRIADVRMLGSDKAITWSQDDDGLHVSVPSEMPCDFVATYAIQLEE
ncbi:MAG: alpha-L-fucosidase [Anaerolineaceae bacterium]|nr:alpha-L-fucosidase [Anaerolineaceae bacterium]